ncbi:MAG: AAA domain-containing protein, partial [Bacteroidota bacterium]
QVVVAGDSMQLQPNDLYRAKWDDQEDEIELSVESLLDLSKYFLEEVQLQGHYRSKSLSLIDFSNQHFYTGSLRLLPHFESEQDQQPAIKYVQTDGIWEDGSNQKEADHVAQLVYDFTIKEAKKSIGIVTFNFRQQNLIYDTVEKLFQEKDLTLPNSLFIKNIENVQGDERDLILFSVGYAPDKKGILRMQFGSLNVEGGENRLNVAITRAKERIIVVASIKPSELKIDSLKNQGPKLLKAYLEYALQVSDGTWVPQIPSEEGHNLAWYLRNKLEQEFTNDRYSLKKDLPFADLSLRSDRQYLGLILTDDERYHRALTPKQIYAYQHFHLQMKGWPHMRIHSRDFWIDREEVMEKIERLRFHTEQDEG